MASDGTYYKRRALLLWLSRAHTTCSKGGLLTTHSGQQHNKTRVRHISSLRTLIRTLHASSRAVLGGEAVWIDQLPPLLRKPLPPTAPRQRLKSEPIIRCFGHGLSHCRSGSRLWGKRRPRKRTAFPLSASQVKAPRGDDQAGGDAK